MISESDQEIIDLIDRGSYNYANSILNKKLIKFPNKSLYHVLGNKILFKCGKQQESIEKNLQLLNQYPTDPQTIEILYDFFLSLGMINEANSAYENILKRFPIQIEPMSRLWFENTIEKYDFKLINKIFMYLNKDSKRDYKFWFVLSYYLLVEYGDVDEKSKNLYISLSLKLLNNLKPFVNNQRIWLYIQFLRLTQDYRSIEDYLTDKQLDLELQIIYLESLKSNQSWEKLNKICHQLLFVDNFDDFDTWKLYILSCKQLNFEYDEVKKNVPNTRNGLLTVIELDKLYNKDHHSSVQAYYDKFNDKLCCYSDLSSYSVTTNQSSNLISVVNNQKFDQKSNNWDIYNQFKHLEVKEYDSNPLNDLTLMSINSDDSNIVQNILILTHLIENDKYNYKLKLALINHHSKLNSNDSILSIYKSLSIKMVQHETLNHYLSYSTYSKDTLSYFIDIFRFYLTSKQEIKHSIIDALDKNVYNKLPNFIQFGKRLSNSISLNFTIYKIIKHSFILSNTNYINYFINYLNDNKHLIIEPFSDNRDYKLSTIHTHDLTVKLKLLIYSMIFESNQDEISKIFKVYNKLISTATFSKFDNVMFKIYYNILKICKIKSSQNEIESLYNYIVKNLKTDKLKQILLPQNILSSELTYNLSNLIELINIIDYINKDNSNILKKLNLNQLRKDIKSLNLVKLQYDAINKISFNFPFQFNHEPILNDLKTSIEQSVNNLITNI